MTKIYTYILKSRVKYSNLAIYIRLRVVINNVVPNHILVQPHKNYHSINWFNFWNKVEWNGEGILKNLVTQKKNKVEWMDAIPSKFTTCRNTLA